MPDPITREHVTRVLETVKRSNPGVEFPGVIQRSWARCLNEYALNPEGGQTGPDTRQQDLERCRETGTLLLSNARAEMSSLFQQLARRETVVVIADAEGIILETVGDGDFVRQAAKVGMRPGGDWSEKASGTNGVGTALVERDLVVVERAEHFFPKLMRLSCIGAPIFDYLGTLVGVLDVTSESDLRQQHFRTLIGMSAQTIENRLFEARFERQPILHLHSRRELVHTFHEALIALDESGRVQAVNQCALFQLGIASRAEIVGRELRDLFETSLGELVSRNDAGGGQAVPVRGVCGRSFFALASLPGRASAPATVAMPWARSDTNAKPAASGASSQQSPRAAEGSPEDGREWGDDGIERDFARALRVFEHGVCVLVEGETGCGKEIFAKALHRSSSRAQGPFVAVNCAAVPETLIESELFGYRGGAFTGASREGRRGRILAADKGTLLLDEIGDMPLALQARLLRVLEEREVTPLGGESSVKVDIRVVCATHRDLREMVSAGTFRSDLYFRLAGFTIGLPPLRARAGRDRLIRAVLADMAPGRTLDAAALACLERFPWPGNLRQLRNVLQTAGALCEGDVIRLADLPASVVEASPVPLAVEEREEGEDNASLSYLDRAEREALLRLLRSHGWNVTRVAAELGTSRNTVYRKVNQYGLVRE